MILLDTNVVSELMRAGSNLLVQTWLDRQPRGDLFLCAPVMSELRYGIERLPMGQRRAAFEDGYRRLKHHIFRNSILDFDVEAAELAGALRARRAHMGHPLSIGDALIASIALTNTMTLATRNVKDFDGLGLTLINPFEPEAA